jgi:hypothetical protein
MPAHVELSSRASRDLRRLGKGPDRKPLVDALTVRRGRRIETGFLVARIVHRRDLERAVASLL